MLAVNKSGSIVMKSIAALALSCAVACMLMCLPNTALAGASVSPSSANLIADAEYASNSGSKIDNALDYNLGAWQSGAYNRDAGYGATCYRIALPSSGRVTLQASATDRLIVFRLYDSTFETILMVLSDCSNDDLSEADDDLAAGTYYLEVAGGNWDDKHRFKVSLSSAQESFPETQDKNDNSPGFANPISLGSTYTGQLAANDEVDYYSFTTKNSGVVRIQVSSNMEGTNYELLDAYGGWVRSNFGSWNEATQRQTFSWTVDVGRDTFIFAVKQWNANSFWTVTTGSYSFSITELPSISTAATETIASKAYTGKEVKPLFAVELNGKTLKRLVDYNVTFSNNINVGTAKATIKGIGDYTGTKTIYFKIHKVNQNMTAKGKKTYVNSLYTMKYKRSVKVNANYSYSINNAQGKITFKKIKASKNNSKFAVKSNGVIVVRKGTPKGTYRLKIKVSAAGNNNYKPMSKVITTTIRVKYW